MKKNLDKIKDLIIALLLLIMIISIEYINNDKYHISSNIETIDSQILMEKARFWGIKF